VVSLLERNEGDAQVRLLGLHLDLLHLSVDLVDLLAVEGLSVHLFLSKNTAHCQGHLLSLAMVPLFGFGNLLFQLLPLLDQGLQIS